MYNSIDNSRCEVNASLVEREPGDPTYAALDTQRVGRMGELVVELELLRRGWIAGNFNATTMNSAGWDLFATRNGRSVKIRVKAKRPGVDCFRWSARADGTIFFGDTGQSDDWVAAVSFDQAGRYDVYVIPTFVVADHLARENAVWLAGTKRDGTARKPTSMRHIYVDDRDDGTPGRGFAIRWSRYRNGWNALIG
jgi:hypothetical protein